MSLRAEDQDDHVEGDQRDRASQPWESGRIDSAKAKRGCEQIEADPANDGDG
jgi:hypothetical protein